MSVTLNSARVSVNALFTHRIETGAVTWFGQPTVESVESVIYPQFWLTDDGYASFSDL